MKKTKNNFIPYRHFYILSFTFYIYSCSIDTFTFYILNLSFYIYLCPIDTFIFYILCFTFYISKRFIVHYKYRRVPHRFPLGRRRQRVNQIGRHR